jgi:C4-dicarboxylate transporter, DctM subunit
MTAALSALLLFIVIFLGVATVCKMPVSYALGLSSLTTLAFAGKSTVTVAQYAFSGIDSFALLAIPFYIFAGYLMQYSGISRMLIDWIKSFIGRVRGATGIITILTCMAFGVLTGSAMATISAIGNIMAPEMDKDGYPRGYTSALLAATCFLGILIPPSVPGIIYALVSNTKISEVWMATIGPAVIFAVGYLIINYFRIGRAQMLPPKMNISTVKRIHDIGKNTLTAIPALLMPVIIYGSIYGGFCTVTEAGAISAVYGIFYFLIVKYITKKGKISISFWKLCAIAGVSTAVIGLLNAFSSVAGKTLALTGVSNFLSGLITAHIQTKVGFLIMINILFLFMGTFMDINATILIMTPLLLPVAQTYGIDPVHFGTILIVNMCVGFLTPPYAVGIFVSSKIAKASFGDTVKEAIPFMIVGLIAIIVTTACPGYIKFFVKLL